MQAGQETAVAVLTVATFAAEAALAAMASYFFTTAAIAAMATKQTGFSAIVATDERETNQTQEKGQTRQNDTIHRENPPKCTNTQGSKHVKASERSPHFRRAREQDRTPSRIFAIRFVSPSG
jgi:hypothetical protein